jgi:hypothetical protein
MLSIGGEELERLFEDGPVLGLSFLKRLPAL